MQWFWLPRQLCGSIVIGFDRWTISNYFHFFEACFWFVECNCFQFPFRWTSVFCLCNSFSNIFQNGQINFRCLLLVLHWFGSVTSFSLQLGFSKCSETRFWNMLYFFAPVCFIDFVDFHSWSAYCALSLEHMTLMLLLSHQSYSSHVLLPLPIYP